MQVAGRGAEAAHVGRQALGGVLALGRYPIGGDADQVPIKSLSQNPCRAVRDPRAGEMEKGFEV